MRTACRVCLRCCFPKPLTPKKETELGKMWLVIRQLTREVLDLAAEAIKPGVTTDEIGT
jgi:hypothetical protein